MEKPLIHVIDHVLLRALMLILNHIKTSSPKPVILLVTQEKTITSIEKQTDRDTFRSSIYLI